MTKSCGAFLTYAWRRKRCDEGVLWPANPALNGYLFVMNGERAEMHGNGAWAEGRI